ncbi:hypothetical protein CLPU_10c01530 [Gottschalkia purinilytica]|uniref:Uncharacterized protein n=1 Tax=Gottschalkia purinilytica TaxID=1503 RepID=A0A0L0W963_GOTPU|nr:hypothetical protein [Gottschalkia purinilytica]KNF08098.1 hypothetical protein CLPU_10c01530 [Gottschalkia purinilytica]
MKNTKLDKRDKAVINTYRSYIKHWQTEEQELLSRLKQVRKDIKDYNKYIDEILGEEAV